MSLRPTASTMAITASLGLCGAIALLWAHSYPAGDSIGCHPVRANGLVLTQDSYGFSTWRGDITAQAMLMRIHMRDQKEMHDWTVVWPRQNSREHPSLAYPPPGINFGWTSHSENRELEIGPPETIWNRMGFWYWHPHMPPDPTFWSDEWTFKFPFWFPFALTLILP